MSLLSLPNEVLLMIANQMESQGTLNALAQTSRFFYALLNRSLYANNVRKGGGWALSWAAKLGQLGTAKKLIAAGAEIEVCPILFPLTPFLIAAQSGSLDVAQLLLERGANLHHLDALNKSAVHLAAEQGHVAMVKMLLKRGAKLVDQTSSRFSHNPLHAAATNGHPEIVRFLLDIGYNVDGTTFGTRKTALQLALEPISLATPKSRKYRRSQKGEAALVLIGHGANVNVSYGSDRLPLHLAIRWRHVKVVERLLEKRAHLYTPMGDLDSPIVRDFYSGRRPEPASAKAEVLTEMANNCGNKEIIQLIQDAFSPLQKTQEHIQCGPEEPVPYEKLFDAVDAPGNFDEHPWSDLKENPLFDIVGVAVTWRTAGGHNGHNIPANNQLGSLRGAMNPLGTTMTLTWDGTGDVESLALL